MPSRFERLTLARLPNKANTWKPHICFVTAPHDESSSVVSNFTFPLEIPTTLSRVATVEVACFGRTFGDAAQYGSEAADLIHSRIADYDGFVVTSDKYDLQYLAPRLAFAFGPGLDKTIVVTGPVSPSNSLYSDEHTTLARAGLIASMPFNEAVILYGNDLLRGTSFQAKSAQGQLTYEPFRPGEHLARIGDNFDTRHMREAGAQNGSFVNNFETNCTNLAYVPGMSRGFLDRLTNLVIQEGKGAIFNMPAWHIPNMSLSSFIGPFDKLVSHQMPVLVTTPLDYDTNDEPSLTQEALGKTGAILARHMSPQVAIAKFLWLIRRVDNQILSGSLSGDRRVSKIRELMEKPYAGEFGITRAFNAFRI